MAIRSLSEAKAGESLGGYEVLIEDFQVAKTKTGKDYGKLTVRDKTMSLQARIWNLSNGLGAIKAGDVVSLQGVVDEWNGTKQLNVDELTPSPEPAYKFVKSSHLDLESMWDYLLKLVDDFSEPLTKYVAEEILTSHASFIEAFKTAPAATKVHNNWYGGLLEHVWSLCQLAVPTIEHYRRNYCNKISKDKVLFGLMLHDAAKIIEYDYSNPAFPKRARGILTNHMVLGPAWVYEKSNEWYAKSDQNRQLMKRTEFQNEQAHLMHVLAAHHGQIEWGSPVKPSSIEAVLVHHLDNLDSKVMHAWDLVRGDEGPIPGMSHPSYFERTSFLRYD